VNIDCMSKVQPSVQLFEP